MIRGRHLHVVVFGLALIAWTIGLLSPVPQQSARATLGSDWVIFLFGKTLHVSAYASLAILGGSSAILHHHRRWVAFGLIAHGIATELIQPHVGRTGSVRDVLLDSLGVGIGLFVLWLCRRWRRSYLAARS